MIDTHNVNIIIIFGAGLVITGTIITAYTIYTFNKAFDRLAKKLGEKKD